MKYTFFLKKAIEQILSDVGDKAERFVIDCIPTWVQKEFYGSTGHELIGLKEKSIPYIVLDNKSQERYEGEVLAKSACYTEDDITAARTQLTGTGLLIITPPGYVLQGSLNTTLYKLPNPFDRAIKLYLQESNHIDLLYIVDVIKQLSREKETPDLSKLDFNWILFKKLVNSLENPDLKPILFSIFGLPYNTNKSNWEEALKTTKKIANEALKNGLRTTFNRFIDKAKEINENGYVESLNQCYKHLALLAGEGATFAQDPFKYYSFDNIIDIPEWWYTLDIAAWNKIFEQPEKQNKSKIQINPINNLFYDTTRKVYTFYENIILETDSASNWHYKTGMIVEGSVTFERGPFDLGDSLEYKIKASQPGNDSVDDNQISVFSFSNQLLPLYLMCETAEKASRPRKKSGGYVFEIELKGPGFHDLKLFLNNEWTIKDGVIKGKDISSMENSLSNKFVVQDISKILPDECQLDLYSVEIFSDEESTYDFTIINNIDNDKSIKATINFTSNEGHQTSVDSNFQKLRFLHLSSRNSNPEIIRQNSKIFDLEILMSKNQDSYLPIVISTDFTNFHIGSKLIENRVCSKKTFIPENDPRPKPAQFDVLIDLIDLRTQLLFELKEITNSNDGFLVEDIELHKHEKIGRTIEKYLSCYLNLLDENDKDINLALSWFDKIALFPAERGITLASFPIAMISSPFHPIVISWQFYVQNILANSLDYNEKGCPIASIISSNNFYNCSVLGFKSNEFKNYISISSNLDYWKLHWNADLISDLEKNEYLDLFRRLNVKLAGIEQGIKSNQVRNAIKQVSLLTHARERVEIMIAGSPEFSGEVNDGIISWAEDNLSPELNEVGISLSLWDKSTHKSVDVFDFRDKIEQPAAEELSYLTNEKKIPIQWFNPPKDSVKDKLDLGFVTKIESTNRELKTYDPENFQSCVSKGCLIRYNLRSQIGHNSVFESKIAGSNYHEKLTFAGTLTEAIFQSEGMVYTINNKNAFYHTPDTQFVDDVIAKSLFCAVSSSLIDTSYITSNRNNYLLWEYYLPTYEFSRDGKDGYFLLSESTNNVVLELFEKKIELFNEGKDQEINSTKLLKSMSDRGLIQLSEFIYAGSNYVGDIGVLITTLLLQPFNLSPSKGIFPVLTANGINLIIPIDPFKDRINYLKNALNYEDLSRPDLLLVSITDESINFIPMEVKCRTGRIDEHTIQNAINVQANSFTKFLKILFEVGKDDPLWALAFPSFISEMILFAHDIYSSNLEENDRTEFRKIKINAIIDGLLNRQINITFDNPGGRLIVVSNHNGVSYFTNIDNDKFNETIFIDKSHVGKILKGDIDWIISIPGYEKNWLQKGKNIIPETQNIETIEIENIPIPGSEEKNIPIIEDISNEKQMDIKTTHDSRKKLSNAQLESIYNRILKTYDEHQISVKPVVDEQYLEGPASILFKIIPGRGIKINKIESLHNELKLELGLRSEQNINFTIDEGAINIDVPKKEIERYFVDAVELWEGWNPPTGHLEVRIGENRYAKLVSLNFSSPNTPHLLIGGQTGSGKSEVLNTILGGLTRYYNEESLRLVLVDPKGTEMVNFENSPHLIGNIGLNDEDAIEFLNMAVSEMDARYNVFKTKRVRSLPEYNLTVVKEDQKPWWLIVLDEYGDLTSDPAAKKNIEILLKRIAQKGRAAGIHLIVTTQNPSAEVISTNIRSNLPAQLALRVRSKTESNIILTQGGAETLNGKGDAILKTALVTERIQCALFKG